MRAVKCPLPSVYHDTDINALWLVWRYDKNENEEAWDILHHIPYLLFYKSMRTMVRFYTRYKTTPIIICSEHNFRLARFGNPHMFLYTANVPIDNLLALDNTSVLHKCSLDYDMYFAGVHELLSEHLVMFEPSNRNHLKNLDIVILYTLFKKLQAIQIAMGGNISENDANKVKNALDYINEVLMDKCRADE